MRENFAQTTHLEVRTDSVEIDTNGIIYAGDDLGRIAIINAETTHYIQAHRAGIKKLVVNFQTRQIVTLSYDRSMAIWQINADLSISELSRTDYPETVWARAACVLNNGQIATGTFGSTYALYDLKSHSWNAKGVEGGLAINAVQLVGPLVYSVGDSGVVHINGEPTLSMGSLCNFISSSGELVLTGGQLGRVFNANTGEVLYSHHSPLNCAASFFIDNSSYIAIGAYTGEILIFEQIGKTQIKIKITIEAFVNAVNGLSYSEGVLFAVCASTQISWYSVQNWSLITRKEKAHERITNACCSIGENKFASVGRDLTLRIWEGDEASIYITPHKNSVKCLGINSDKTVILTGSYGGTLSLFDLDKKTFIKTSRPTSSGISSITWDNSNDCFLAGSYDGEIYKLSAH
jgi:WD40 repeat protein